MSVVVLPDVQIPPTLACKVAEGGVGSVLFRHPSGRPWIMGTGRSRRTVHATNRHIEVVVIGNSVNVDDKDLADLIAGKTSVSDLDLLAARLAEGDVLFLAREQGRMRSQAPLFLMKSLCWASVDDVSVVSDEQLMLKNIAGLGPDPAVVASRLTNAEISYPFDLQSIWRGLGTVGPGEWLDSRAEKLPTRVVWWLPPEPGSSVGQLGDQLHDDIAAALQLRTAGQEAMPRRLN